MVSKKDKNALRRIRHARVRKKVSGTPDCPRLCVYRSTSNIYAQVIDDVNGLTLAAASSLDASIKEQAQEMTKTQVSEAVGKEVARRALEKDIKCVVFDRGGYIYHGRVEALAKGAREAGLEF